MEALKKLGWMLLSVAILVAVAFAATLMINGMAWVSSHVLEYLITLNNIVTVVCIVLLISLAPFRKTRIVPYGLYVASFVFGVCVWVYGFAVTYQIWGGVGVFIGFLLGIVGIVPLGIIAASWHSEWAIVAELIYGLVLTYGARAIALWLWEKIEADANRPGNVQRASVAASDADNGSMEWQTFLEHDSGVSRAVERLSWLSPRNVEEFRTLLLQSRDCNRVREFEEEAIRRIQGPAFVGDASLQQAYISLNREDGRLGDEFVTVVGVIGKPEDLERTVAQIRKKSSELRNPVVVAPPPAIGALDKGPKSRNPRQPSRRALVTACLLGLVLIGSVGGWLAFVHRAPVPVSTPVTTGSSEDAAAAYRGGDYATAQRLYRQLADQGLAVAQNALGDMYYNGSGMPQNYGEAIKWYRLAADQGDTQAQINLGAMYADGHAVRKNDAEAVKWYRLAADRGDVRAQTRLGFMYGEGRGVQKNDVEALRWYRLAADQGYAAAEYELGLTYEKGDGVQSNYAEAVKWYRLAAEQGFVNAQSKLGIMYLRAQGVPQDDAEAVKWFSKAADQGTAVAQDLLGTMYDNGRGVPKNQTEAARLYRLAANQGNANAQTNLGSMYYNGRGVPQSFDEALKWFRLAADHGYSEAQDSLGAMYDEGRGVPQNNAEAVKWYRLAADQGNAQAQYGLGLMYAQGVQKNYVTAHMWFSLAAAQGNQGAAKIRDLVERSMTTTQIAEAQKLAREWKTMQER